MIVVCRATNRYDPREVMRSVTFRKITEATPTDAAFVITSAAGTFPDAGKSCEK